MRTSKLLILITALSLNTSFAQKNVAKDEQQRAQKFYLELPRIEVIPIKDTKTDRQYELYIKLPETYSEDKETEYPVIYYTDAMWHVEILSGSAEYLVEEAILVGISWEKNLKGELGALGTHASRYRDYSIRKSSNPEHQTKYQLGQASNHLTFIRDEVIKYVEKNYQTDANNRSYFGYSMGGLFGAYTLVTQPDTFKNYILGSPALKNDNAVLSELDSIVSLKHKGINANVFVSYGDLEKEAGNHIEEFISLLKNKNDPSLSLVHVVLEGSHQSAFPMTAVRSMEWLSSINSLPVTVSPYLGQKPPGATAEVFAPGIVSTGLYELFSAFTPDMKEFYFVRYDADDKPSMIVLKSQNNHWQESVIGPRVGEPFISPDGNTMHLGKRFMERIGDDWSVVKSLEAPFNDMRIMRLSTSSIGTYYFDTNGEEPIRCSPLISGKHEEVKALDIDFGKHNAHPWIAPDESYLIWDDQRESGYGGADIYISFKQKNGSWGPALNLGDKVNSDRSDSYATVTPDGKYMLFNRSIDKDNVDIYWVDASFIETLRPH
jgi:predicted alpha/beta superfamily hydrolase